MEKKILYTEVNSAMKAVWIPDINEERKFAVLELEKVSVTDSIQRIEIYFVNIKARYQITLAGSGDNAMVTKIVVLDY